MAATDPDQHPLLLAAREMGLSATQTEYFLLEYRDGWSAESVAQHFGVSAHTVATQRYRIQRKVRGATAAYHSRQEISERRLALEAERRLSNGGM